MQSAAAIRIATSEGNGSGSGLSSTTIRTAQSGQPLRPPLSALSRTDCVIIAAAAAAASDSGNQPCSTVTDACSFVGSARIVTSATSVWPAT